MNLKIPLVVILLLTTTSVLISCSDKPDDTHRAKDPTNLHKTEKSESNEVDFDLIVIGAGISGLATALELANHTRTILVVDMASIFGGHAVMSAGGLAIIDTPMQREKGIRDSAELAFNDFVTWGDDVNQEWVEYYVENSSKEIYDWVTELGVEFVFIIQPHGNSVPRMHFPRDSGLGLVKPIYQAALKSDNISFRWNTRADELIVQDGRVVGVKVSNIRSNQQDELYAHAITIATGGFQSNLDMVRENWREDLPAPDLLLAGSGWYSQGSGIDMATEAGAKLEHLSYMWNYIDGAPDPRYPGENRALRVIGGNPSIWLNEEGDRFVNECLSVKDTLLAVLQQAGKSHWMVFDSVGKEKVRVAGSGWTPEKVNSEIFSNEDVVKSADSLSELAEKMSVPPERLIQSFNRFNTMVEQGQDDDFGRFGGNARLKGRCNNISKLENPPYYAIKRYPIARKSMGGIKIDIKGRVLNIESNVIPGLYAAGEATGFGGINGKAGLEGTFLGSSIVTGKVAGRTIADELQALPSIQTHDQSPDAMNNIVSKENGSANIDCNLCHNISSLVTMKRYGYKHFEFVHKNVLEKNLTCKTCHSEMLPYKVVSHKIEPMAFVESCQHCHGSGD